MTAFILKLVVVALPSGTVLVDVPSPSVVSGVGNRLNYVALTSKTSIELCV